MSACQARWVAALARGLCLSLSLAMMPAIAMAAAAEADTSLETISAREQAVMATRTFLNAHPDLKYRNEGWEAYQAGDHVAAMAHFTKASLYADKASQAMVAEMTWKGQGVPEDRAMAYAWADLAAERGYVQFVKLREQYWRALDVAQRERAVQQGSALVDDYADAVAKPRMAHFMKKAKQRMRRYAPYASRPNEVRVPGPSGSMVSIPAHRFYDSQFWDPVEYQAWQDAVWKHMPEGKVDVGDVEQVRPTKP